MTDTPLYIWLDSKGRIVSHNQDFLDYPYTAIDLTRYVSVDKIQGEEND